MNLLLSLALAFSLASLGQARDAKEPSPRQSAPEIDSPSPSYPLLARTFRAGLNRDQLAALGADASLEKVRDAMTSEQRGAARERLAEAEANAKTPEALKEIAKGYFLLDERSPDAGRSVIRVAERLRQLEPEKSDGFTLAASGLHQMGDYPAASEWAKKALERDPDDKTAQAVYMLSVGRLKRGGPGLTGPVASPEASGQSGPLAQAEWVMPEKDVSPEALSLMRQAVEARRAGDFERTRRLAQAAMNADPASAGVQKFFNSVDADHRKHADTMEYLRLSREALDAGRGAEAVEWAQKAADRSRHPTVSKILELTRQKSAKFSQAAMRPEGEEKKAPAGGPPRWPIGVGLGLGLIGFGIYRARKSGDTKNDASPSEAPHGPGFFSDPIGKVSDFASRAKVAIEDHPYIAGGAALGALALGGWLVAGPTALLGGGMFISGGATALAPAAATSVAVPAGGVTLAQVGPAVAAGTLLLMAGDHRETTSKDKKDESKTGATGEDTKRVTNPSKSESQIWKKLENFKNGIKRTGQGSRTQYYKWDNLHNDIEVFDARGKHMGSMDPTTGEMYKPPKGYSITSEL